MDISQAYLLEKALGGSVDVENEAVSSRTNLAIDPNPPTPPPPPAPALDMVVLLDIPDECVARRAVSQMGRVQWLLMQCICVPPFIFCRLMCACIHTQVIIYMYIVCLCVYKLLLFPKLAQVPILLLLLLLLPIQPLQKISCFWHSFHTGKKNI